MNDQPNTQLVVKTSNPVVAQISPWAQAAQEELGSAFFSGSLLRYNKGDWLLGETKEPIGPTTPLLANMEEYYRGWIRWHGGAVSDHRIGRVIDNFIVPAREELGNLDQGAWEADPGGAMKRDPWQRCVYLCLRNTANDQPMVFTSTSDGGRRAVAKLAQQFDQQRQKHPDQMPLVALASETYHHETFGKIAKPAFKIIGWEPWEVEAPATPGEPKTPLAEHVLPEIVDDLADLEPVAF